MHIHYSCMCDSYKSKQLILTIRLQMETKRLQGVSIVFDLIRISY